MKALLALCILTLTPSAHATKLVGNGGDEYAIQFVDVGRQVLQFLEKSPVKGIDREKLRNAMEKTEVESTEKDLILLGKPKDAINYPELKKIVINRARWGAISVNFPNQAALVLHEYLGIIGADDTGYKLSKKVLKELNAGRANVFEAKDFGAKGELYVEIFGSAAKKIFDKLDAPEEPLGRLEVVTLNKWANGITCSVTRGAEDYSCQITVGPAGVL